jgi:signal transduction histidine kinase
MVQNGFNCQQGISATGECVAILDAITNRATWLSDVFNQTFPVLNTDSSINQILDEIGSSPGQKHDLNRIIQYDEKNGNSYHSVKCGRYEALVSQIGDMKTLIRLQDASLCDEAYGRHLEDREKLIFTARSISVSEMASTLAHEINQPVGTINNLLHGIRDRLSRQENHDPELIHAIDKSIEQAQYTSDIIHRIRDYTHSIKPNIDRIDLTQLIDKCISLMDWEMRHTNVKIEHIKNVTNALVQGDELMLQQVIVNLIRNGIESMIDQEKIIEITTDSEDNYNKIAIKDNGKGLTNDELDIIFIPFSSNKTTGMGIGLNICRSFIELHRGKIWLTQNADRGCTAHLLLPTHAQESL